MPLFKPASSNAWQFEEGCYHYGKAHLKLQLV